MSCLLSQSHLNASNSGEELKGMAFTRALSSIRSGVLSRLQLESSAQITPVALSIFSRGFAEGTYLSKDDVTERVLNVVKNFDKIDPAKVSSKCVLIKWQALTHGCQTYCGAEYQKSSLICDDSHMALKRDPC